MEELSRLEHNISFELFKEFILKLKPHRTDKLIRRILGSRIGKWIVPKRLGLQLRDIKDVSYFIGDYYRSDTNIKLRLKDLLRALSEEELYKKNENLVSPYIGILATFENFSSEYKITLKYNQKCLEVTPEDRRFERVPKSLEDSLKFLYEKQR